MYFSCPPPKSRIPRPLKRPGLLPPTDPTDISRLWRRVMAGERKAPVTRVPRLTPAARSTGRDRATGRGAIDSGIGSSARTRPPLHLPIRPSDSGLGSSGEPSDVGSSISRASRTADARFDAEVLTPRGITIDQHAGDIFEPWSHFNTFEPPTDGLSHFYRSLPGLENTTVWLEGDADFIETVLHEYQTMRDLEENEAEHAAYAIEALLKREPRSQYLGDDRPWKPERKIEFPTKPEPLWEPPPLLPLDASNDRGVVRPYGFNIPPDCSYWISLQAFNPHYRSHVKRVVSVRQKRLLCPYLSIEFKRNDRTMRQAISQVAVASAIALYNRYNLKLERMRRTASTAPWDARHAAVLRHYGLVMAGRSYQFWCTEAVLGEDEAWKGCRMFLLFESECDQRQEVRKFVDWINEIHRWGLTVHGPDCEDDVKHCIQQASKATRTSLPDAPLSG
ncbi:hypothetical protein BFW01_g1729 [Lasiodiplodia theobromae]|nr:hypothetical protein BFW01_g1729 [Lasiodiplodia theobromae]